MSPNRRYRTVVLRCCYVGACVCTLLCAVFDKTSTKAAGTAALARLLQSQDDTALFGEFVKYGVLNRSRVARLRSCALLAVTLYAPLVDTDIQPAGTTLRTVGLPTHAAGVRWAKILAGSAKINKYLGADVEKHRFALWRQMVLGVAMLGVAGLSLTLPETDVATVELAFGVSEETKERSLSTLLAALHHADSVRKPQEGESHLIKMCRRLLALRDLQAVMDVVIKDDKNFFIALPIQHVPRLPGQQLVAPAADAVMEPKVYLSDIDGNVPAQVTSVFRELFQYGEFKCSEEGSPTQTVAASIDVEKKRKREEKKLESVKKSGGDHGGQGVLIMTVYYT
jgi:hypothetical protein